MINESNTNNSKTSMANSNQNLQSWIQQSLQNNILILKEQVKSLSIKNRQLQVYNQQLLMDLAQSKQKESKLKQLNNILTDNLKDYSPNVHQSIKLTLEGEFMSKRILELEQELQKYQNGVHQSVQRRVKKIVGEFTEQQELDYSKKASRITTKKLETHNHNISHNHYKIQYNKTNNSQKYQSQQNDEDNLGAVQSSIVQKYEINIHQQTKAICPKCLNLTQQLYQNSQQTKHFERELQQVFQQLKMKQGLYLGLRKQNQSLKKQINYLKSHRKNDESSQKVQMEKYIQQLSQQYQERLKELDHNWQIRYDNLLQQYELLLDELNSYGSKKSNTQKYTIQQSPINFFKKKNVFQVKNQNDNQQSNNNNRNQMLKDISNLVNGLGAARKQRQKQQNFLNVNQNRSRMTQKSNKIGSSSRMSTATETAMFTIKQGVNRPTKNTFY